MCTAITLQSKQLEIFFGRTMDFSYNIDPKPYIVPKYYVWNNVLNMHKSYNCYSFIVIGQESDGMLGFFDGVNEKGLKIFQNQIGVMANSPDFQWHMTNLRNYMDVSPTQTSDASWGKIHLKPFGQAVGTMQLPGGYTSPEIFVRTAYQNTHIQTPNNSLDAINACFHIMESVTILKGVVITNRDTYDYTKYTAFINTNTC